MGTVRVATVQSSGGKTWAILAHVPIFAIYMPGIALAIKGETNRFVKHHAVEALNFQITVMALGMIGALALIPSVVTANTGTPAAFFVFFGIMGVLQWLLAIRGMWVAWRGKLYRYPLSVRLIKGALPKGTEAERT